LLSAGKIFKLPVVNFGLLKIMRVDENTVLKIADLAKITLTPAEARIYAPQMEKIIEYIEQLQSVDTSQIEPLSHVHEISNVFREDKAAQSLERAAVFQNAPAHRQNYFVVPKVIKDGDS